MSGRRRSTRTRYLAAFRTELAHRARIAPRRTVSSVFFGGGTPSLMQPATVGAILDAIAAHWTVAPDAEVTLEANPTSVEAERFRGYRAAGINRVSLGVQAMNDADLKALGRLHTVDEAMAAVAIAASIFERYSFDLIYARPCPVAGRLEGRAQRRHRSRRRAPVALSADHRARHDVREAAPRRQADRARRRSGARPVGRDPGGHRGARAAGLRDLQPRPARRGIAAQPHLLALRRICRRRPRRAWAAAHADRPAPRAIDRAASRDVADGGRGRGPRPRQPTRRCRARSRATNSC